MRRRKNLDEMEQDILVRSMVCAYKFMLIVLCVWVIAGFFLKISVVLPGYILVGQALVRFISEQIYKRSVDDERWIRNSFVLLCGIAVGIFIILFIPLAYIGMGAL